MSIVTNIINDKAIVITKSGTVYPKWNCYPHLHLSNQQRKKITKKLKQKLICNKNIQITSKSFINYTTILISHITNIPLDICHIIQQYNVPLFTKTLQPNTPWSFKKKYYFHRLGRYYQNKFKNCELFNYETIYQTHVEPINRILYLKKRNMQSKTILFNLQSGGMYSNWIYPYQNDTDTDSEIEAPFPLPRGEIFYQAPVGPMPLPLEGPMPLPLEGPSPEPNVFLLPPPQLDEPDIDLNMFPTALNNQLHSATLTTNPNYCFRDWTSIITLNAHNNDVRTRILNYTDNIPNPTMGNNRLIPINPAWLTPVPATFVPNVLHARTVLFDTCWTKATNPTPTNIQQNKTLTLDWPLASEWRQVTSITPQAIRLVINRVCDTFSTFNLVDRPLSVWSVLWQYAVDVGATPIGNSIQVARFDSPDLFRGYALWAKILISHTFNYQRLVTAERLRTPNRTITFEVNHENYLYFYIPFFAKYYKDTYQNARRDPFTNIDDWTLIDVYHNITNRINATPYITKIYHMIQDMLQFNHRNIFVYFSVGNAFYPIQHGVPPRPNRPRNLPSWITDTNSGSGDQFLTEFITLQYLTILIYPRIPGPAVRGGRFWKWFHNTEFDFTPLEIFKKLPKDYKDTCFITSLQTLGYTNQSKLNNLRQLLHRNRITNREMVKIATILDIHIILYSEYRMNNRSQRKHKWQQYSWNETASSTYTFVETEDHYMPYLKFNFTKSSLSRYHTIKSIYPTTYKHMQHDGRYRYIKPTDLQHCPIWSYKTINKKRTWIKITKDIRADTKDIIEFLLFTPNVQHPISAASLNQYCNLINSPLHYNVLSPCLSHMQKPIVLSHFQYYHQIINDFNRKIKKNPNVAYYKKQWIQQHVSHHHGQPYAIPSLPSKFNILYQPNKFDSPLSLRKEFIHLKYSKNGFKHVTSHNKTQAFVDFKYQHNPFYQQWKIIYLDIESGFNTGPGQSSSYLPNEHIPFIVSYYDGSQSHSFVGTNCIIDCLESLQGKYMIYVHNLKYDIQFIFRHLQSNHRHKFNLLKSENQYYNVHAYYETKKHFLNELYFKDSYKLIQAPLGKFGRMFNLPQQKEVCPYRLYHLQNLHNDTVLLQDALLYLDKTEHNSFISNCKKWNLFVDTCRIKHIDYAKIYCEMDCKVLCQGLTQFREWIYLVTLQDIHDCLTIPTIAHKYFIETNCYDGCVMISNIPRYFIQKCVVGGRVMTKQNKKINVVNTIQDFDAVSLYPSAMKRLSDIGGFLKGPPKLLTPSQRSYSFLSSQDGYFIRIQVHHTDPLDFPLLSIKNKNGIRQFQNFHNSNAIVYVDKITLEDCIQFCNIQYTILDGYYFNEGRNNTTGTVIQHLFNERKNKKQQHNPIQSVYKLCMNSAYGKTIQKAHNTSITLVNNNNLVSYISKNYMDIKHIQPIHKGSFTIVTRHSSINTHYSLPHIGCEILSMSKRIMNEVMVCAQQHHVPIYYQDTDSMHIQASKLSILTTNYQRIYQRSLIGSNLGQFHCDFESDKGNVLHSSHFIGLGKKCYIDLLVLDNHIIDYHIRMKGVSIAAILYYCFKHNITPLQLYTNLYNGELCEFDLCSNHKPIFDFLQNMRITSRTSFVRQILFK